ncbi:MAG TPA: cation-transporting P-type ATPase [Nocardioidaceae bacterium]|nr:cation-transporting P-type ATPase [Nocardioidaceae bacterium]
MSVVGSPDEALTHHDLPVHELLLVLETDRHAGLGEEEAARRLEKYGPNELPRVATLSPFMRLLLQMHNPLIYVLLVSGAVTIFLGAYVDASVILGVVVVNTIVGFVQETKAEAALDALRSMVHTEARVVRGGGQRGVPSEELVPGDLVLVGAGDKLPADLRLIAASLLWVDESALTGESVPVAKDEVVLPTTTPVADRRNMAYSGTLVTGGTGAGIVVATGGETELGEIHRLVGSSKTLATPLTRKLARFSKLLTVAILALAAVTFAIGVVRGQPGAEMFTAAVALAVGAIPEGLPAAVTITLAIGVSRMARRRAVIRRLPAVETLGGATVICSDKTGTLTENRMTVRTVWTPSDEHHLAPEQPGDRATGSGGSPEVAAGPARHRVLGEPSRGMTDEALRWCLLAGANCNDAELIASGEVVGDPTEGAMLAAARRFGIVAHGLPRVGTLPFSSARQYMATRHTDPDTGRFVVLVKGALERVLDLCDAQMEPDGALRPLDRSAALEAAHHLADQGMRVLATAVMLDAPSECLDTLEADDSGPLSFTGLQAMLDPPRATAAAAVRTCRTAGLSVKMITGDHVATATAIARQVGLLDEGDGGVLTGEDLDRIADPDLPEAVEHAAVFARVTPEQKLRLVEALQARHHVVAMTGDGVNDAPALKQADIGVAMGRVGTEVAKEAGDMVLTDDDFATIEAAVEEGRGVFDNLTKFIVWTLPTNTGEAMVILVAILLGSSLPILPTQILWINMTTAVLLGLTLAWEPKERGLMERPPRDPRQSLLTGEVLFRTLLVSALLVAGAWWVFDYEITHGASIEVSRTAALNLFVAVEIFYLFSCRSLVDPMWRLGVLSNKWLLVGVGLQVLGQLAITYLPVMNVLFHTEPIGLDAWWRILLVAAGAASVVSLDKLRVRARSR